MKFKDTNGKEWTYVINVGTIAAVKKETDFSIHKMHEEKFKAFTDLCDDPFLFARVSYVLCGGKDAGVSLDEFCTALGGDTLVDMGKAMWDAYVFFSPSRAKPTLKRMIEEGERVQEKVQAKLMQRAEKELASLDLDAMAEAEVTRIMSQLSTSLPDSSASIPAA